MIGFLFGAAFGAFAMLIAWEMTRGSDSGRYAGWVLVGTLLLVALVGMFALLPTSQEAPSVAKTTQSGR